MTSHEGGLPLSFSVDRFQDFDPASVAVESVESVESLYGRYGGRCLLLRGILTPDECAYLIKAMSVDMESVQYRIDYRRNDRCIFDSPEMAELLWQRVRPFTKGFDLCVDLDSAKQRLASEEPAECPEELYVGYGKEGVWRPEGLNECIRFCRYTPGGFFRAHCDGPFCRAEDEQSLFTCMFYLDGGFDGGSTRFLKNGCLTAENHLKPAADEQVLATVVPEPGLCILFFQPGLLHEGEDLRSGVKHILRTDVMCRRDVSTKPQRTPEQTEALALAMQAQAAEAAKDFNLACQLYSRAFKMDPRLERVF